MEATDDVAITVDYWTSCANESYLGVTAHFLNSEFELTDRALGVLKTEERHTADHVATQIMSVCDGWNISNKLRTVGSDNARNMTNAVGNLGPTVQLIPCAAHSLQLAVRKALTASAVDGVLAKVRKIVGHVKHSAHALVLLHELELEMKEPELALLSVIKAVRAISTVTTLTYHTF